MTRQDVHQIVYRAAENSSFKLVARASMILISLVTLPLGIYIGSHSLNQIDEMQRQIAILTTDVKVLTSEVRAGSDGRYKIDDARRDLQLRDLRIDSNKDRTEKLERAVDELRQFLRK